MVHLAVAGILMCAPPLVWGLGFDGKDLSGLACKGNGQGYGPFDYTNPQHYKYRLPIVEQNHFTPDVARLIRGKSGTVLGDLDYTLRAFPNHHRALFALIRLVTEPGRMERHGMGVLQSQPECYLQRALRFKPNDGKAQMLFGLYLHKLGKLAEAETYYREAQKLMPNSAEANYNLGLVLFDQDKFAAAVPFARKAYQLGYPLAGLRKQLTAAGHPLTP